MLVEPSYLFSASPVPEPGEPSLDASLPLRCQVVIHALRAGKPVSWEVTASLESVMQPRLEGPGREDRPQQVGKAWDKPLHRLAARSVIRDNENAAQREAELEQGGCRCVCPSPSITQHLPTSIHFALGRFRPPVPPESCANQQNLQCAFSLHPPGARGWCHTGSPARSPRGVGHRYSQGAWHAGERTAMGERAEVAPSLAASSTRQSRATAAGSWHHRSSSVGLGQQRDMEELDEAPVTAGTCISLCSPGSCLSTGVPVDPWLIAEWGIVLAGALWMPGKRDLPHTREIRGRSSIAAPGSSCGP